MAIKIDQNEISAAGVGVQIGVPDNTKIKIGVTRNKIQDVDVGVSVIDTSSWGKVGIPENAPPQFVVQFFRELSKQSEIKPEVVEETLEKSNLGRWLDSSEKVAKIVSAIVAAAASGANFLG